MKNKLTVHQQYLKTRKRNQSQLEFIKNWKKTIPKMLQERVQIFWPTTQITKKTIAKVKKLVLKIAKLEKLYPKSKTRLVIETINNEKI